MSFDLADWLPLIQSLGWTLLHFLWQGAAIGLGYATLRLILPADHAEARYNAGLVALVLIAICPPLTLGIVYPHVVAAAGAEPTAIDAVVASVSSAAAEPDATFTLDRVLPWLVLSWVLGVAIMAWRALRQWQALERIAHRCAEPSSDLERMLASLAKRFGLARSIRVLVSAQIDTPTLIGWLKPVILLPVAMVTQLTTAQIEAILVHELAHIRRKDYLLNLLITVVELLFFFNPFTRLLVAQLKKEREHCCDDAVLEFRYDPHGYVSALLSLARQQQQTSLAVAAIGLVALSIAITIPQLRPAPPPPPHLVEQVAPGECASDKVMVRMNGTTACLNAQMDGVRVRFDEDPNTMSWDEANSPINADRWKTAHHVNLSADLEPASSAAAQP